MEAIERLAPLVAAVVTAVTPIVLAIMSNGKKDRTQRRENSDKLCETMDGLKGSIDRMDRRIGVLEEHSLEDYRRLLIMELMEENLPMEERLQAGKKYVDEGWNGPIKALYESLLEQYKEELKKRKEETV